MSKTTQDLRAVESVRSSHARHQPASYKELGQGTQPLAAKGTGSLHPLRAPSLPPFSFHHDAANSSGTQELIHLLL